MIGYKGLCSACGKNYWIVKPSLELCMYCNSKRLTKPKKIKGEADMFKTIWSTREHKSFLSSKNLDCYENTPFYFNLFAHVIPKGTYPKMRLNPENIVLLTPFEHELYDKGTEEKRVKYAKENNCDWNKLYELKEKIKVNYLNYAIK